jgi:type I restriction enzyme S subunit
MPRVGFGIAAIPYDNAKIALVPLPPLSEQHRIVAKVDELMGLCDQLEAHLTAAEADSRRLLEAVLHEALSSTLERTA